MINKDYGSNFKKDNQTLVFQDCKKFCCYETWIIELIEIVKILREHEYYITGKVQFQNESVCDCWILDMMHKKINIIKIDLDNIAFITSNIWNASS
jgi:hypothetical protein